MCYVDDIYVYLRARADGALGRVRPAKHDDKPAEFAKAGRRLHGRKLSERSHDGKRGPLWLGAALLFAAVVAGPAAARAQGAGLDAGSNSSIPRCCGSAPTPTTCRSPTRRTKASRTRSRSCWRRSSQEARLCWYPQATGFVRNTLGAHRCDVILGFPQGDELAQITNPYYRTAYALVSSRQRPR